MFELWLPLKDIPAEGREFHFTDQSLWTVPMREFKLGMRPGKDFSARMSVVPQDDGFLVSGSFSGSVIAPCDRCAEDVELELSGEFESFEEPCGKDAEHADECRIRQARGVLDLDAAGILWEQFMLALPVNPLCGPDCKGLCAKCGADLNRGDCGCGKDQGDPRLAVLRNLKIS